MSTYDEFAKDPERKRRLDAEYIKALEDELRCEKCTRNEFVQYCIKRCRELEQTTDGHDCGRYRAYKDCLDTIRNLRETL